VVLVVVLLLEVVAAVVVLAALLEPSVSEDLAEVELVATLLTAAGCRSWPRQALNNEAVAAA